uniref:Secreted protein n=1 Tax=Mesocestoides corti TaxID=53468 RepID=A0A5K3G3Y2_MESCO
YLHAVAFFLLSFQRLSTPHVETAELDDFTSRPQSSCRTGLEPSEGTLQLWLQRFAWGFPVPYSAVLSQPRKHPFGADFPTAVTQPDNHSIQPSALLPVGFGCSRTSKSIHSDCTNGTIRFPFLSR